MWRVGRWGLGEVVRWLVRALRRVSKSEGGNEGEDCGGGGDDWVEGEVRAGAW